MDNDEIVAGQAVTDLSRAKAVSKVVGIIELLEAGLRENVPALPAADAVALTKWPVYAQGWSDCRDACLKVLTEVRTVGDRYETALAALEGQR